MTASFDVDALVAARRPGSALPGPLYCAPEAHAADLRRIWHREWVFACAEAELARPGGFVTLTVGDHPVLVVRDRSGGLHALHNVCRHRGSLICTAPSGTVGRRLVCPYHQWVYELDGRFVNARAIGDGSAAEAEPAGRLDLGPVHVASAGGLVFVCVADDPPPFEPFGRLLEDYLAPFGLAAAEVAHTSTIVEAGNWKLVMENNRECYHCRSAHPELCKTFPQAPLHSGGGSEQERAATEDLLARCRAAGLASDFVAAADHSYRAMRMAFVDGARSMTMDGEPAVGRPFPGLPVAAAGDVGDVLVYHYPSTWSHFMADHAVTFRILPLGPDRTELRTTWLVPPGARPGEDYDLDRLTEVWLATNAQDGALVEATQRGVTSPAFRPGPYSPVEEEGVIQFVDWYVGRMTGRSPQPAGAPPPAAAVVPLDLREPAPDPA